jgi:Flp pilus assembly protein CpaB
VRLRALPLHFDRRTAVGLALALAAGILVFALTRPGETVAVLVAEGPLPVGVPLETLPVGVRRVPDATGLVAGDDAAALAGWTLSAPLAAGEPLLPSLLRAPERRAQPDVLALSLERDRAVLGDLQAGDLIDVYVTVVGGEEPAASHLVAAAVHVVAAGPAPSGLGGEDRVDLLLAVDDALAAALVTARNEGELDLVRVAR